MDSFPATVREYSKELELPPRKQRGWVHEVEVPMLAGDMLHYASDHDGPGDRIEFNVHSHQGKAVTYHAKTVESSIVGAFSAPAEGKFYLMWENLSDELVRVRIHATRHEIHQVPIAEKEKHQHG